ncbi:Pectinesterase, catalytic [Sesbania bispinosa]|nr:Pectinesterase, catalytic [Sesbania bispinosa]
MALKTRSSTIHIALIVAFLTTNVVLSDDNVPIPDGKSQLNVWFNKNVAPFAQRKSTLDPALVTAENGAKVVRVMQDGSGDFKTITDAINSIPNGNTKRVILYIGEHRIEITWRQKDEEDNVYSFVHCDITGTGSGTFLGRAWFSHSKVVYAYTTMSNVVNPAGWSNNMHAL